ncbi:hypothetical protein GOV03_01995 [Candidatus Woesearchaeota archaeon]|nr:hypothetical protein [Candidatus Woesearchaeota archaeon]
MRNKTIILILGLFLFSIFSIGVLAEVPTPAEAFSNMGSFFSDLFTGSASWENAYLLSFVLYFILFMAIFVEGLRAMPLFGGKGSLSAPGKWFAFAAAMLATIGIFVGEQVTGKSTKEAVSNLVTPFGIWGAVAIAAIVAVISYKGIKDLKIFGDSVMRAMASAAAIGLMITGWIISPALFGWGFMIVVVVLLVGLLTWFRKNRGTSSKTADLGKKTKKEKYTPTYNRKGGNKEVAKVEKKVEQAQEYATREIYELKDIKKEIKNAKTVDDLKKIKNDRLRTLERVERRMESRFKGLENAGKKLISKSPEKKGDIEKALKEFKTYTKTLVVALSRGGILETALTYPEPKTWLSELGKMVTMKEAGSNFKARKINSLTAIKTILKWDEGFYIKLKQFEKMLKK